MKDKKKARIYSLKKRINKLMDTKVNSPGINQVMESIKRLNDEIERVKSAEKIYMVERGESSKTRVYQFSLDGKFIQKFDSIDEASKRTGYHRNTISRFIHGRQKCKKFIFKKGKRRDFLLHKYVNAG